MEGVSNHTCHETTTSGAREGRGDQGAYGDPENPEPGEADCAWPHRAGEVALPWCLRTRESRYQGVLGISMQPNRELVEEVVKIAVLWETRVGGKRVYDTRVALLPRPGV